MIGRQPKSPDTLSNYAEQTYLMSSEKDPK